MPLRYVDVDLNLNLNATLDVDLDRATLGRASKVGASTSFASINARSSS